MLTFNINMQTTYDIPITDSHGQRLVTNWVYSSYATLFIVPFNVATLQFAFNG